MPKPDLSNAFRLDASRALWTQAQAAIPGGTSTNSKRVTAFADAETYPAYLVSGGGCRVTDADGNSYIDFVAALAPVVLGYNPPRLNQAIKAQIDRGVLLSLPPPEEVALAERLIRLIPGAEMARFFKTGAEAVSAAVRAARTLTGRDLVLCCGYHGWHDWYAAVRVPAGVPDAVADLTRSFAFNDLEAAAALVAEHGEGVACIVVTPAEYGRHPDPDFLEGLRRLADDVGAVLVFDEIITGFRWALGGAQTKYGVVPDLAAFGKAMANGWPIAALTGRRRFMQPLTEAWVTSTYASDGVSLVAALTTLDILEETDAFARLYAASGELRAGLLTIGEAAGAPVTVGDHLPATTFEVLPGDPRQAEVNERFIRACARKGVLIRRDGTGFSLCLMAAHGPADIAEALAVFADALGESLAV